MNAYVLAALPPALLLIVDPMLWPWALAVAAFVALSVLGAAALRFRRLLAVSEAECEQLARVAKAAAAEALQLDQENMALADQLAELQLLAGTGRVPLLRVVPNGGQS